MTRNRIPYVPPFIAGLAMALGLAACTNGGDGPIVDPEGAAPESPAGSPTLGNQIPPGMGFDPDDGVDVGRPPPLPPFDMPETLPSPPRAGDDDDDDLMPPVPPHAGDDDDDDDVVVDPTPVRIRLFPDDLGPIDPIAADEVVYVGVGIGPSGCTLGDEEAGRDAIDYVSGRTHGRLHLGLDVWSADGSFDLPAEEEALYAIAESCADLLMVHGVYGIELVLDDRGGLLPDERFDEHAKALTSAFIRALADVLHPDHELALALPGTVMPKNVLDDDVFELLDHLDFLVPR